MEKRKVKTEAAIAHCVLKSDGWTVSSSATAGIGVYSVESCKFFIS